MAIGRRGVRMRDEERERKGEGKREWAMKGRRKRGEDETKKGKKGRGEKRKKGTRE